MILPKGFEREFQFDISRKWRFDYCWVESRVALEVEGGAWTGGRHTRGSGFIKDIEKYNTATLAGWQVYRCTPQQVKSGEAFDLITKALEIKRNGLQ